MSDPRNGNGAGVAILLAIVTVLVLLAGGGAVFIWQRQAALHQEALVQRERAVAAEARARAEAERRLSQATQSLQTAPEEASGTSDHPESIADSLRTIFQLQQRAWNAGDIDQFMQYYWKSDDLTFNSGGTVTRTWEGALNNYKERYPSQGDMGQVSFKNLEITPLGREAALVLGEWHLSREAGELEGTFTVVFRRVGGKWVIIHDHTSRTGATPSGEPESKPGEPGA